MLPNLTTIFWVDPVGNQNSQRTIMEQLGAVTGTITSRKKKKERQNVQIYIVCVGGETVVEELLHYHPHLATELGMLIDPIRVQNNLCRLQLVTPAAFRLKQASHKHNLGNSDLTIDTLYTSMYTTWKASVDEEVERQNEKK